MQGAPALAPADRRYSPRTLFCNLPCLVRIICGYRLSNFLSIGPQILLIDLAVLIDNKGHDSGISVFHGIGDKGESASQFSIHKIVHSAARRVRPLTLEEPIDIAVKWSSAFFLPVALVESIRDQWAYRTRRFTLSRFPVESIMFAFVAHQLLGVVFRFPVSRQTGVFLLGIDQGVKRIDCVKFVPANPPVQDLPFAGGRSEAPGAIPLHERDWKWPVFCTEIERRRPAGIRHKPVHLLVLFQKFFASLFIGDIITGLKYLFRFGAKNPDQLVRIIISYCGDHCHDRFLWRAVRILIRLSYHVDDVDKYGHGGEYRHREYGSPANTFGN